MNEVMIKMVENPEFLSDVAVNSREEAINLCLDKISDLTQEAVLAINFDAEFVPINCCLVSMGTVDQSICRPADFWKSAILSNAKYTICAHNHPVPGSLNPSPSDLKLSRDLAMAGWHIGITLLDFLIVQDSTYVSFMDSCPEYVNMRLIMGEDNDEHGEDH